MIFSIAWIGVSSCMVVLSLMGLSFDDPRMVEAIYQALKIFDLTVITITSFTSVASGIRWRATHRGGCSNTGG